MKDVLSYKSTLVFITDIRLKYLIHVALPGQSWRLLTLDQGKPLWELFYFMIFNWALILFYIFFILDRYIWMGKKDLDSQIMYRIILKSGTESTHQRSPTFEGLFGAPKLWNSENSLFGESHIFLVRTNNNLIRGNTTYKYFLK